MKSGMTRREFLRYLTLGSAGALLAACQPKTIEKIVKETVVVPGEEKVVKETVVAQHLNLRIGWWGGLARNDIYNAICDLYQEKNPSITLVREYAAWGDYFTKVATQAAGGNLPDITASVIDSLAEYAQRGAYAPLDPFVEAGIIDVSDWDPLVVDHGKVDGVVYMMTTGVTSNCVIVNQDLIKRAGLQPPQFETTFEEFSSLCHALQAKLSENTWATTNGGGYSEHFQSWVLQKGYQIANEDATDVGFPKEVMVDFFRYWNGLYKDSVVIPIEISSQPLGDAWADSFLAKGQVGMMYINTNQIKIFQKYTEDDLVIMRNPTMPDGKNKTGEYFRGSALSVAANSDHKQEAATFVNWFVNDLEATKIFNMELGAVGPKHVQDALRTQIDPKDVLVLDHFNAILKDIPYKLPDPKGTGAVLAAHRRANDAICYGTPIEQAVDTFLSEAKDAYKVNQK